ncbi:MAG: site-specific integrase [Labilithrix sp.]|nr:site-specific integrase [Labilithrix sp.]
MRAPVNTESQARRWGEAKERELFAAGPASPITESKRATPDPDRKEVPTLAEFWPRFIREHCEANKQKPSGIERKQCAWRTWLEPRLGSKRLDEIGASDISALKGDLAKRSSKSANNVLTALSACLKFAGPEGVRRSEGLGIIERVPKIRLLPVDNERTPEFYEEHDYRRLVDGAARVSPSVRLLVLLAGSAGLRRGEIIALKWTDLDLKRGKIHVQRSIWWAKDGKRHETVPKGGRGRVVPMTGPLAEALKAHRNLRERVVTQDDGSELTNKVVRMWLERAQRAARLEQCGGIHRLRHTFCSHLAMRGATVMAIKALAGHASISTTQRYMHLSPSTLDAAIGLLDAAWNAPEVGETVEKVAAS